MPDREHLADYFARCMAESIAKFLMHHRLHAGWQITEDYRQRVYHYGRLKRSLRPLEMKPQAQWRDAA